MRSVRWGTVVAAAAVALTAHAASADAAPTVTAVRLDIAPDGQALSAAYPPGNIVERPYLSASGDVAVFGTADGLWKRSVGAATTTALPSDPVNAAVVSGNGRYVVVRTRQALVPADVDDARDDVYRIDTKKGNAAVLVSDGDTLAGGDAAISDDGRWVLYSSVDASGRLLTLRDLTSRTSTLIRRAGSSATIQPEAVSADGRVIGYVTRATQNGRLVGIVRNVGDGTQIDLTSGYRDGKRRSVYNVSLDADGSSIAWDAADPGGGVRVWATDLPGGRVEVVSTTGDGRPPTGEGIGSGCCQGGSGLSSISADGRFVSYFSTGTNIVADDYSPLGAYVVDRSTSVTRRVGFDRNGVPAVLWPGQTMSGNGRYVLLYTDASRMTSAITTGLHAYRVPVTAKVAPGDVPRRPTITGVTVTDRKVTATYQGPQPGPGGITGYDLHFQGGVQAHADGATPVPMTSGPLQPGTYLVQVRGVNANGYGFLSAPVAVTIT